MQLRGGEKRDFACTDLQGGAEDQQPVRPAVVGQRSDRRGRPLGRDVLAEEHHP